MKVNYEYFIKVFQVFQIFSFRKAGSLFMFQVRSVGPFGK